jgi:hypothetical protein
MKPHQTAKAAVAKMVVMAIEISNEIAVSLIQSVTSQFPVGPIAGPSYVDILIVMLWPFMQHAVAIFHRCVIVDREQRGLKQIIRRYRTAVRDVAHVEYPTLIFIAVVVVAVALLLMLLVGLIVDRHRDQFGRTRQVAPARHHGWPYVFRLFEPALFQ